MTKSPHIPVMLEEVLQAVEPSDGQIYLDATFGAGGYSRALLESSQCKVYAIDRDPSVAETAAKLAEAFPGRFCWLLGNFGDMIELLAEKGVNSVDAIIMDIGVSSMQIDQSERGFSFRNDGPLDMRMSSDGISAADVVNKFDEEELANIIYTYGEERKSRWVARAIVEYRKTTPITRTSQLAEIVRKVVRGGKDGVDPATRTFQALRIHVNDELGELTKALNSADKILSGEGKLVVVTFHSLEDRIVKQFFQSRSGETRGGSRHLPQNWSNNNA
ncbi:MAG: 16S rRNA (cytosine(1402)-N(4))-methyltransferase RsmH, partial [Pseudomonadota bacterium]